MEDIDSFIKSKNVSLTYTQDVHVVFGRTVVEYDCWLALLSVITPSCKAGANGSDARRSYINAETAPSFLTHDTLIGLDFLEEDEVEHP